MERSTKPHGDVTGIPAGLHPGSFNLVSQHVWLYIICLELALQSQADNPPHSQGNHCISRQRELLTKTTSVMHDTTSFPMRTVLRI